MDTPWHLAMFCISFGVDLLLYMGLPCFVGSVVRLCRSSISSSFFFSSACALLCFVKPRCMNHLVFVRLVFSWDVLTSCLCHCNPSSRTRIRLDYLGHFLCDE